MDSSINELHDWYLAYLRKNAQRKACARDLTPMALVRADCELLKEYIESQACSLSCQADELAAAQKGAKRSRRPRHLRTLQLCSGAAIALAWIIALFLNASSPFFMTLLALTGITLLFCLFLLFANPPDSNLEEALLSMLSANSFLKDSDARNTKNSPQYICESVDRLLKQLELMQQKEALIVDFCPYLLCKANRERRIVDLNATASKMLAFAGSELRGLSVEELLSAKCRQKLLDSFESCKKNSNAEEIEISLADGDGTTRDLRWRTEWSASADAYFCIGEDITAARENDRLKEEMTAMINHDLRAPVAALVFWVDNMLSGTYGDPGDRAVVSLRRTMRNLKGVLALLDNLLDLEKLEAGSFRAVSSKMPLNDCLRQVNDLLSDWTEEWQIELEIENTDLIIVGDPALVSRILLNFCSNAIKWSGKRKKVCLRCRQESSFAVVEIEDQGPGIPPELQDSLFQRWGAIGTPARKNSPSTGLGLYIARKFAELQGGAVGMRNAEQGGAIFWVSIPLASPPQ